MGSAEKCAEQLRFVMKAKKCLYELYQRRCTEQRLSV